MAVFLCQQGVVGGKGFGYGGDGYDGEVYGEVEGEEEGGVSEGMRGRLWGGEGGGE